MKTKNNMGEGLSFNGKKYISAKEAAKIAGYTSDYVGQLCRAGKIECRMVGHTWFVLEESLLNHKQLNIHQSSSKVSIVSEIVSEAVLNNKRDFQGQGNIVIAEKSEPFKYDSDSSLLIPKVKKNTHSESKATARSQPESKKHFNKLKPDRNLKVPKPLFLSRPTSFKFPRQFFSKLGTLALSAILVKN